MSVKRETYDAILSLVPPRYGFVRPSAICTPECHPVTGSPVRITHPLEYPISRQVQILNLDAGPSLRGPTS